MKKFALIGAAGYIAPRHMKAIKDTGNDLLAAYDVNDSVGIIDSYFPNAHFFTELGRFDRHIEKLKYDNNTFLDYISICSPNYLHDSHIRFALRSGAHAICEKPLVLNIRNLEKLEKIQDQTGRKIYNILQLRYHKDIIALKKKINTESVQRKYQIDLSYITSRGNWYMNSWKGDISKSGGIASNIGIHFFDMLIWIFGSVEKYHVSETKMDYMEGFLELEKAQVSWKLSTNSKYLPQPIKTKGQTTYRSLTINNEEFEFSNGFTDLHTKVYQEIISNQGFGLKDTRASIELVEKLRSI